MQASVSSVFTRVLKMNSESYQLVLEYAQIHPPVILPVARESAEPGSLLLPSNSAPTNSVSAAANSIPALTSSNSAPAGPASAPTSCAPPPIASSTFNRAWQSFKALSSTEKLPRSSSQSTNPTPSPAAPSFTVPCTVSRPPAVQTISQFSQTATSPAAPGSTPLSNAAGPHSTTQTYSQLIVSTSSITSKSAVSAVSPSATEYSTSIPSPISASASSSAIPAISANAPNSANSVHSAIPPTPAASNASTNTPEHTLTFTWAGNEGETAILQRFLQAKADFLHMAVTQRVILALHLSFTSSQRSPSSMSNASPPNTTFSTPFVADTSPCSVSTSIISASMISSSDVSSSTTSADQASASSTSVTKPPAPPPKSQTTPSDSAPSSNPNQSINSRYLKATMKDIVGCNITPHADSLDTLAVQFDSTTDAEQPMPHVHAELSIERTNLALCALSFSRTSSTGSISLSTMISLLRHCELSSVTRLKFSEGCGVACLRGLEWGCWSVLSSLHLEGCGLTQLPDLRGLSGLRELHVPANKLAFLSVELSRLTLLRVLQANNNLLTGLPGEMRCLTQLRELHLANNRLSNLSFSPSSFPYLQALDLRSNTLMTQVPDLRGACPKLTFLGFSNFTVRSSSPALGDCQVELFEVVPNTSREVQLGPLLRQVTGQGAGVHPLLAGALVAISRDLEDAGVLAANEGVVQQLMDMAMSVEPLVVQQANIVIETIARNPEVTSKLSRSNLSGLRTILLLSTGPDHPLRSRSPSNYRRLKPHEPLSRSLPSAVPFTWCSPSNPQLTPTPSRLALSPHPSTTRVPSATSPSTSLPINTHSHSTLFSPSHASSSLLCSSSLPSSSSTTSRSPLAEPTLAATSLEAGSDTPLLGSPVTTPPTSPRQPPRHTSHKSAASIWAPSADRPPLPVINTLASSPIRSSSAPPQASYPGSSSVSASPATTPTGAAAGSQGWASGRVRRISQEPFREQRRVQLARHRAACCVEMVNAYGEAMEASLQAAGAEGALTACNRVAADKFGEAAELGMAMVAFTGELYRKEKNLMRSLTLLEAIDSKLATLEGTLDRLDQSSLSLAKHLGIREDPDSYVSQLTNPSCYSLTNLRNLVPTGITGLGTSPAK